MDKILEQLMLYLEQGDFTKAKGYASLHRLKVEAIVSVYSLVIHSQQSFIIKHIHNIKPA